MKPTIETVEVTPAAAATMLRRALRGVFPGTAFDVRFNRGRIVVSYTDGPRRDEVRQITSRYAPPYRYQHPPSHEPVQVRVDGRLLPARFTAPVVVERRFSFAVFQAAVSALCEVHGLRPLNIGCTPGGQFYAKSAYVQTESGLVDLNQEVGRLLNGWSSYDEEDGES